MDWLGNRRERIVYRRVSLVDLLEGEDLKWVTGGSLTLSAFTALHASGTLNFHAPIGIDDSFSSKDLIRIIYQFEDDDGDVATVPIATLLVDGVEPSYDATSVSGKIQLLSVLKIAKDKSYGMPFTIKGGTNAVGKAVELIESLGLHTNNPECNYTISNDHVFDFDESVLDIVNWLLDTAGYAACYPDANGVIQMDPYVPPDKRDSRWVFDDGRYSIMLPNVDVTDKCQKIPNACRLFYETDEESIWAATINDYKYSPASISNRGYETTLTKSITELAGETPEQRLEALKRQSRSMLLDNSSDIEYVQIQHPYVPLTPNAAITVHYGSAGFDWGGCITDMDITLSASMPTRTKARRFIKRYDTLDTIGGVY